MARDINRIVLHCTATAQNTKVENIQKYWREALGWAAPGYHRILKPDGEVVTLAPDEKVCNGVAGHNSRSLHVSYIGGVDAKGKPVDNRTEAQKLAMESVIRVWLAKYPKALVVGHRDFLKRGTPEWKDCPSFDAKKWWESVIKLKPICP